MISDFIVMQEMAEMDNGDDLAVFPLGDNLREIDIKKKVARVTISVSPDIARSIANGTHIGGLYLVKKDVFRKLKRKEQPQPESKT